MKVLVQPDLMFLDQQTKLEHGVNYIDEKLTPKLAAMVQRKLDTKYPGIELYEGKTPGYDPKGSRRKRKDLEDEATARKAQAKIKAKEDVVVPKVKEE